MSAPQPRRLTGCVLVIAATHRVADAACAALDLPRSTRRLTARSAWPDGFLFDDVVWVKGWDVRGLYRRPEQTRRFVEMVKAKRPSHTVTEREVTL